MAAVATEPRAAGAPSAAGDGAELEPEPAARSVVLGAEPAEECASIVDAAALSEDGDAFHRPDSEAHTTFPGHPGEYGAEVTAECHGSVEPGRDGGNSAAEFPRSVPAPSELSTAVSLHSHPARPPAAGSVLPEPSAVQCQAALSEPWLEPGQGSRPALDAVPPQLECAQFTESGECRSDSDGLEEVGSTGAERDIITARTERVPAVPAGQVDAHLEEPLKPAVPCAGSITHLMPGSEVRVSLDHVIDDALVVSFQLGEKIFSGVLMDLSKRFGPYGIPVTVFPKREHRDKSESMQLKSEPFQPEMVKGENQDTSLSPKEPDQSSALSNPPSTPWTLKPPPLFQEGVPYPPPLFIRDTYNQSIPQPPPRKIKRPKRRLYREEPTSIMNAIKLRPRQVLCDKCKGAVAGDKRELRRGPGADCRAEDAKRRRGEGGAAMAKRPRSEERGRSGEGHRRQAPAVGQAKGGAAGKVVKAMTPTASSTTNSSRVQLSTKKVLQNKNVDHSKAREVLKMAKAQRRQRDTPSGDAGAKTTRASSLRDAHQKVHFTRRLHQISGGPGGAPGRANPLPPRIRIKPQSAATLKGC